MKNTDSSKWLEHLSSIPSLIGIGLILVGVLILLNQSLRTGWMTLLVLPAISLLLVFQGFRSHQINIIILGSIVICLSIGGLITLVLMLESTWVQKAGVVLMALGASFLSICAISFAYKKLPLFWALLPGGFLSSAGSSLVFSEDLSIFSLINYVCIGLGIAFVIWGIAKQLIGFIILGCLLLGIGPGIYQAWNIQISLNALANTGTMLVWFAFGFALIILFSRLFLHHYVWWPILPGGVLFIVGWSLFIGGNPERALAFISNTGSVGIIILGIYLLLLRRGIGR